MPRAGLRLGSSFHVRPHVTRRQNAFDSIVIAEEERSFFRLQFLVAARHAWALEHDLARLLGNDTARGSHSGRIRTIQQNLYPGLQCEEIPFGHVIHTRGGATGLRYAKLDFFFRVGVAGLLVEYEAAGLEMYGIFQFLGRGLIRAGEACRIRLKVNLDIPLGAYIAGLRVIFEIGSVNPVVAAGIATVNNYVHIVQLGATSLLELDSLAGAYSEYRASLFRARDSELLRALLDFISDFLGDCLQSLAHLPVAEEVCRGDNHGDDDRAQSKPAPQTGNRNQHQGSVYFKKSDRYELQENRDYWPARSGEIIKRPGVFLASLLSCW